jgi:transposase-like protein
MTVAIARDPIYRGRRFQPEIIELCVRWYLTYRLSYRDLVEMMAERSVTVSHTTIFRWVQRYVPEFESRWSRYAKPVHSSWRMDETAELHDAEILKITRPVQWSWQDDDSEAA